MDMLLVTRVVGFVLILLGVVGYVATGFASMTALIPAFVGAVFLIIALVGRRAGARRHAMHAAVALALITAIGMVPRIIPAVTAGDMTRPAVLAQMLMAVILVIYVMIGIKSFIDARRARIG
jgi:hypothetical protein